MESARAACVRLRMGKEQQLVDFRSELSHRSEQISGLEHQLASLQGELASREQRNFDLERELECREQGHSDLQREFVRQGSKIERLKIASHTDQEQVARLQGALAESGGNISHLERKIESMKSSRSEWSGDNLAE
jgi:chromosome segregation ATPase